MCVTTQTHPACNAGRALHVVLRRSLAGVVVLAASAFSSATAAAGLREYSSNHDNSADPSITAPVSAPVSASSSFVAVNSDENKFSQTHFDRNWSDPLADDRFAPLHYMIYPTPTLHGSLPVVSQPVADVNNAGAKSEKGSPLLIPLPTAVTAGASGLVALALLLASPRIRRRLLA